MREGYQKRKWVVAGAFVCLLLLVLTAAGTSLILRREERARKRETAAVISLLLEYAPETPLPEIALRLQQKEGIKETEEAERFLSVYGMDRAYYAGKTAGTGRRFLVLNGAVLLLSAGGFYLLGTMLIRERNRELSRVTEYVAQLNRGDYALFLSESRNHEMSRLKDEVYRTTVMLRERAERESGEAKDLERSLEDISHQLRTPLAAMQITIDNLREHPEMEEEKKKEFLRELSRNTEHLSQLAVMLLKLSRFDAGVIRMKKETVSLAALFREALSRVEILGEIREVPVRVREESAKDLTLELDREWELEALTNLLKNAVEHSPAGSTVTLWAEKNAIFTSIFVEDQGEGISPADLPRIFERFYKAKNASPESFGVGLSLAKSIVEADGGTISVNSREGEGTKFRLSFPHAERPSPGKD